jgi:Ni,Fe-hydrogenase III small subunit
MKMLNLDASKWRSVGEFYDALLSAIGAPEGHGAGGDAFNDSMVWGGMNEIEPPYTVHISGTAEVPADVMSAILEVIDSIEDGRRDHIARRGSDVDVSIEIVS